MSFPVFSSATVLTSGTLPFTTATILVEDYNYMVNTVRDIMGRNPNGYGVDAIFSVPVNTGTKITSLQWEQLRRDVNIIHGHITSSTTATVAFTTGTLYQTLTLSSLTNSTSSNVLIFNTMSSASLVSGDIIYDSTITIVTVYTNSATIVTSEPITNLSTGKNIQISLSPPRSTSRIDASRTNALNAALLWSSSTRYTCAEDEYIADIDTGETINIFNGISTRTIPFGLGTQTEIKHEYTAVFSDADNMRYFFNQGGEFKWFPFYRPPEAGDATLGDIDFLWGNFINYYLSSKTTSTIRNPSVPEEFWTYDRGTFITHSSTLTTYSSGTLEMIIQAGVINQGTYTNKGIVMTATLRNTDIGDWTIAPTSGYWNYTV